MKKSEKRKLRGEKKQAKDGQLPPKYASLYGHVTVDYNEGSAGFDKVINGENVHFSIKCTNRQEVVDKLPFFGEIVDKYAELNAKAKNAIIEWFNKEKSWSLIGFFHEIFNYLEYEGKKYKGKMRDIEIKTFGTDDFGKVDIKYAVEYMDCDDVRICCYSDGDISISLSYPAPGMGMYCRECLVVGMDKNFMVTDFLPILD